VNGLDVILVVLLVVAAISGYRRGATLQVFSYGGLLGGLVAGALLAPSLAAMVETPAARAGVAVATIVLAGALGDALGWLLGSRVRARTRVSRVGRADSAGGSLVALVATLVAIWFLALNLVNGPFPGIASQVQGSSIVRGLGGAFPDPPSIVGQVRRFFDRFGFPEVFEGIPPDPGQPVRDPTSEETELAIELASASTVQILGRACDQIQEGSGFVVADGYVVTNAHVVAGVTEPEVRTSTGIAAAGSTVFFDPELDLAVLRVNTPLGPSLALATADVERGAVGAVLGYPEGGPLVGSSAAVRQSIPAIGHDIYGRSDIERDVYELQTEVRPGNSGGPFVLPDGRVAGIVFAASSVDPDIGYALRATEILDELERALGSTVDVDTGACIH
jgi:S1-C subfamily serine protease